MTLCPLGQAGGMEVVSTMARDGRDLVALAEGIQADSTHEFITPCQNLHNAASGVDVVGDLPQRVHGR